MQLIVSWSNTDPDAPSCDPYFETMVLLWHGEGTNGATSTLDSSQYAYTTKNYAASGKTSTVNSSRSKFGASSLDFVGSGVNAATDGGCWKTQTSDRLRLQGVEFTIEFWVYIDSAPTSYAYLIDSRPVSTEGAYLALRLNPSRQLELYVLSAVRITSSALSAGVWHHVALVRKTVTPGVGSSRRTTMYVDGVIQTYWEDTTDYSAYDFVFGCSSYHGDVTIGNCYYGFDGALDEIRITIGTARYPYDANFTPDGAAFPDVTCLPAESSDPNWNSVSLLLRGDGDPGSTTIVDSSNNSHSLTLSGGINLNAAIIKWGSACLYFDGSNDKIVLPSHSSFGFGAGDWTVEGWVYIDQRERDCCLFDNRNGSNVGIAIYTSIAAGTHNNWLAVASNTAIMAEAGGITPQAWRHIAVTRSGNTISGYHDGTRLFTVTDTRTYASSGVAPTLGQNSGGAAGGQPFIGSLDDFRITKGVARYTGATYTVPSSRFPGS